MKLIKYITLFTAAVLLAGCATTFRPWNLSEVQEGMNRDQVVNILGQPDSSEVKDGAEFLYYSYNEDYNPSSLPNSGASTDSPAQYIQDNQMKRSLLEYKYSVQLVDGEVLEYKELTK